MRTVVYNRRRNRNSACLPWAGSFGQTLPTLRHGRSRTAKEAFIVFLPRCSRGINSPFREVSPFCCSLEQFPATNDRGHTCASIGILLVVAAFSITPSTARASCGSYVTINGRPIRHSATLPLVVDGDTASPPSQPVKMPCTGPNCGSPTAPHVPPAAPVKLSEGNDTPWWFEPAGTTGAHSARLFSNANRPAAVLIYLAGIFRPPRAI